MLRRVACARVGRAVAASAPVAAAAAAASAPSCYSATTQPFLLSTPAFAATACRAYSSRSGNGAKKDPVEAKPPRAATAAAATAAQVFATNEKPRASSSSASATAAVSAAQPSSGSEDMTTDTLKKEQQEEVLGTPVAASSSGIRSIGIKLSEDDEIVRAFNNFSKSVNGCTQEEFLMGVKQAYASLAVVISAFVEKAQQPLVGLTESSKVIAAAHEAANLLAQEFKPEKSSSKTSATDAAAAAAAATATTTTKTAAAASPKAKLEDILVQHVVSTITSIIPVSKHLAEFIFKIWMLQKEKQVNLSTIASPADYVLASKLVVFARLDKARIYFNSDNIGAEVDVTLNNDYLRKLDQAKVGTTSSNTTSTASSASGAGNTKAQKNDDDDVDEGMIEVLTDTTANATRATEEEHTFVVDRKTRKLTRKMTPKSAPSGAVLEAAAAATPSSSSGKTAPEDKGATTSRVQVTCVKARENMTSGKISDTKADGEKQQQQQEQQDQQQRPSECATADDVNACSVLIKVNGSALPPIPADARACALLSVDVVVPPERYAYNFEWFYKRIVGYENEYERIAAARLFASNSPKSLGNFLDFVMRMLTGEPVEFMFSKSIGRMIGIPEDVSETPPATRKLMCMYMDASYKWVLADLITLAPVIETKLPKA